MIEILLVLVVIILIAGTLPTWSYSRSWGYTPTGVLTLLLVIFLIWAIVGGRPFSSGSGRDINTTVQEAGQDLKSAGRDVADSIKDTVR